MKKHIGWNNNEIRQTTLREDDSEYDYNGLYDEQLVINDKNETLL